jgi:hypothetical protein
MSGADISLLLYLSPFALCKCHSWGMRDVEAWHRHIADNWLNWVSMLFDGFAVYLFGI